MIKKITAGFVIQDFNLAGKCISQEFVASDDVDYEDEFGDAVVTEDMVVMVEALYFSFEMKQPEKINNKLDITL